ncbi:methylmalonyl-CoA mutase family protein [Hansschlegelia plantiphila]|uniref:Methylmalonyl-CoA mutase n=1 Tax=Hansschlegelia plantiphila TaxID=374655 RepID=A0A9W6MTX0_9HYPH|nr:methylmalonyl-CoA mutase family protein [Hansschlegelia plantiphila]GLK66804.1 methylmalonyl-CoA mutase [Hansschlegelia plantiphila]
MTTEPIQPATGFAADFTSTEEAWRKAAEAALKGRPLSSVLSHRTIDGVPADAIAPRAEPRTIAGRDAGARWIAMTRIDLADPAAANAQALEDLNNGASGLSLFLAHAHGPYGLLADTLARVERALDGVMLDLAPIHLDAPPFDDRTTAALFAAVVENRKLDPGAVRILFGLDYTRDLLQMGTCALPWDRTGARASATLKSLLDRGFTAPALMMDQRLAHDSGASEAQELAGALSSAVEHIRMMTANGLDVETVADSMSFAFACDADQFATIAKLRAARLLWSAARRELGLADRPVHIHAQTSRRMMTRKDPQTNMIRTTIAAFAAGVGGADSVTVLPYTFALAEADADARRLARNAQSIVLEESNAYRVADPAAGAGAIERLTDGLAERAWELFREIEREGGMFAALTTGVWQSGVKETWAKRAREVATRKSAIVGVSEFPRAGEVTPSAAAAVRPEPAPRTHPLPPLDDDDAATFTAIVDGFLAGASVADVNAAWKANPSLSATPLEVERLADPFESLRDLNEAREPRPKAFLAVVGPIARHAARAGFVRNLLTAGGVQAVEGPVGATDDDVAAAYAASGAALAVVCGADADYAEAGAGVVVALKRQGATVWLAGRPKEGREALETAGVGRFVAAGDDAIDVLTAASDLSARTAKTGGAS